MSVSVSMPQLGESVTEGTVTRWLKKEGERVERDEPLLEISTDKVDTEIPSPAAGILRGIVVAEDETVAVGAELALIDEDEGAGQPAAATPQPGPAAAQAEQAPVQSEQAPAPGEQAPAQARQAPGRPMADGSGPEAGRESPAVAFPGQVPAGPASSATAPPAAPPRAAPPPPPAAAPPAAPAAAARADQASREQPQAPGQSAAPPAQSAPPPASQFRGPPVAAPYQPPASRPAPPQAAPYQQAPYQQAPYQQAPYQGTPAGAPRPDAAPPPAEPAGQPPAAAAGSQVADAGVPSPPSGPDTPYVTPLVRKLATEHGVNLAEVSGTGVGGRIRKQDVLDAARARRDSGAAAAAQQAPAGTAGPAAPGQGYAAAAEAPAASAVPAAAASGALGRPAVVPSTLRGTTEHMSRLRQVIAQRMVESLQTSAQLTTVVEADVTAIARLRQRAKTEFEAREGVRLTFLPFFALAALEALKIHPKLNAVLDAQTAEITYHDAEHLGVAVDTERGLLVPVIRNAGDLNIGGLARKIADLAQRTRDGKVSPDELAGGTFTLTNTGSRGALFDTPIINQPQVAILGTGTVVKRPVVVEDPMLGEVIAVRSVVYLALTYDHRLIDGADAARFLSTVKNRLEEGAFEAELGL
jgi:pyruvate dehydrogenase E2 component (dihydrolipoamide acetyltransferase)